MRIAVIGTGISGLAAAYLLQQRHHVTLYEKNDRLGGHSRTIDVAADGVPVPVDTGFIVFNERNYPHLTGMFHHLGVGCHKSDMSFGASIGNGFIEYGSKGMFAQKKNFLRPAFLRMVADILRFNRQAEKYLDHGADMTLGQCLDKMKVGDWFRRYYLQAMGAAIWSCSVETILSFPASTFIRFFKNHGLLTVNDHPQWYTVTGGSRAYVAKIANALTGDVRLNAAVTAVERTPEGIAVTDIHGRRDIYDHVVCAGHADETLAMLKAPTAQEREILGAFRFQKNDVVVHTDSSFMPARRAAWASWIYLSETTEDHADSVSLTYWMNNLQNLPTDRQVFVTLNPGRAPAVEAVQDRHTFSHPVFTSEAVRAQARIPSIQGAAGISYCGAWQRYGFHEDGLLSAVNVAKNLGIEAPWL